MERNIWRVYRVERAEEVSKALALFRVRFGENPRRARVSPKADGEVIKALQAEGIEVEATATVLPWDVWLTAEVLRPQQLSLI